MLQECREEFFRVKFSKSNSFISHFHFWIKQVGIWHWFWANWISILLHKSWAKTRTVAPRSRITSKQKGREIIDAIRIPRICPLFAAPILWLLISSINLGEQARASVVVDIIICCWCFFLMSLQNALKRSLLFSFQFFSFFFLLSFFSTIHWDFDQQFSFVSLLFYIFTVFFSFTSHIAPKTHTHNKSKRRRKKKATIHARWSFEWVLNALDSVLLERHMWSDWRPYDR